MTECQAGEHGYRPQFMCMYLVMALHTTNEPSTSWSAS